LGKPDFEAREVGTPRHGSPRWPAVERGGFSSPFSDAAALRQPLDSHRQGWCNATGDNSTPRLAQCPNPAARAGRDCLPRPMTEEHRPVYRSGSAPRTRTHGHRSGGLRFQIASRRILAGSDHAAPLARKPRRSGAFSHGRGWVRTSDLSRVKDRTSGPGRIRRSRARARSGASVPHVTCARAAIAPADAISCAA
jgi:hypothetical protein